MSIKSSFLIGACLTLLTLQGCSAEPPAVESNVEQADALEGTECRNGGSRLELSGICEDAALATLNMAGGSEPMLMEGCSWELQETQFASDVLIYRAASCQGTTSRLEFSSGAQQAELRLETSALGLPTGADSEPLIRVISSDPDAPTANLEFFTRNAMDDAAEAENCFARPANLEGWPTDAIVVDIKDAPQFDEDGPRSACGPYGFHGGEMQYWRVFNDFSWFFSLGQDGYQDIDMSSLTLITMP
jgi:hypothetical protein